MKKNKRKNKFNIKVLILLLLVFTAGGIYNAYKYGYSYKEEKALKIEVDSSSDLFSNSKTFYNDSISLKNDIEITDLPILTISNRPFIGTFDGHGYTVTLKGTINNSLIGYIGEQGIIRNLNIFLDNCIVNSDFIGLIANENRGLIENCKISGNIIIDNEAVVSPLVAVNKGKINNIATDKINIKSKNSTINQNFTTVYGTIASFNYGIIENVIVQNYFENIKEAEKTEIFDKSAKNFYLGGVCGSNIDGTIKGLLILEKNQYTSDIEEESLVVSTNVQLLDSQYIFSTLKFDPNFWEYKNGILNLIVKGSK